MTQARTTYRPSQFVVWHQGDDAHRRPKFTLRKLGTATTFWDQAPTHYGSAAVENPRWQARITVDRGSDLAFLDPDARCWSLMTQGPDVGGRRYRRGLTLEEAQEKALAWLDRRFTVTGVED